MAVVFGFVLYAVTHLPAASNLLLFLLLVLSFGPPFTIVASQEAIFHLECAFEKKTGSKPPTRWAGFARDGAVTAIVLAMVVLSCISLLEKNWYFWVIPVVVLFIGPAMGAQVSLWRYAKFANKG